MRALLTAVLLGSLAVGTALAEPTRGAMFPYPVKVTTLPNGVSVVRVPFNSPGLMAYYTVMRVGSRNEVEAHHTGFAHFFEHMMFRGTKAYPPGEREKILSKLGFDDNAFTTDDVTIYHLTGPSSALEKVVEVEADRFQNLDYAEAAFQTEAKAVLGEYHKNAAHPDLKIEEVIDATAFTQHPYRHTTLGFYEDIKKMPDYYEYSRQFFKRWYTPDNAMIYVVGDFDDKALMGWIKQRYGGWQGKSAQIKIPVEPPQTEERFAQIEWETPTLPREVHSWHTPAGGVKTLDGPIQTVLGPYLVGPTSPAYQDLVLKQQLAEQVAFYFVDHRDPQLFSMFAVLKDEKNRADVKKRLDGAVAELASGKVDTQRVEEIKSNVRYSLLMSLERPGQVGAQLGFLGGVLGSPTALEQYLQNVAKVQPKQLVAFTKKYLSDSNRTVLTLTAKPSSAAPAAGEH